VIINNCLTSLRTETCHGIDKYTYDSEAVQELSTVYLIESSIFSPQISVETHPDLNMRSLSLL
jgi:hypothetical protein